jgi:hypothetical protein
LTDQPDEISRPRRRRLRASPGIAAVTVFAMIVAVVLLLLFTADDRPGDRVDLLGSTWTVTEIDRTPVNGLITLKFDDGANFGRLTSDCSSLGFEWETDTDGSSFSFAERSFEDTGCSTEAKARDARLRAAFTHVKAWRSPAWTRIEFLSGSGTSVLAAQRGKVK